MKATVTETLVSKAPVNPELSSVPINFHGDRALINPLEIEKTLSDKVPIVKSTQHKEPFRKGILVSISAGEYGIEIPKSLRLGDTVQYFHEQAIEYILGSSDDKKVYHLVRISEILATV